MTLQEWKQWKGYNLANFAKALEISESFASLLLNSKRGPSPEMALQIERLTNGRVRREEVMWPKKERRHHVQRSH